MKKISLVLAFAMLLSLALPLSSVVVASEYVNETFNNATPNTLLSGGGGFMYVARPADYADVVATAVGEGTERALLSGKVNNGYALTTLPAGISGKVSFEIDFRVEGPSTSTARTLRLFDLYGTTNLSSTAAQIFALTTGGNSATSYRLSPLYNNNTAATGPNLEYKKWYKMTLVLDTTNAQLQCYIGNDLLVSGSCYHGSGTVTVVNTLTKVEASHKNNTTSHPSYFITDNLKVSDYVPPAEPVGFTAEAYTVGTSTITEIPADTSVAGFLSNITLTGSATGKAVVQRDGVTPKASGNITTGDKLVITPGDLTYYLILKDEVVNETFDGNIAALVSVPITWKKIEKPADLTVVDYSTAVGIGDTSGLDRALLSKTEGDTEKLAVDFPTPLSGAMSFEYDFRIEDPQPAAGLGSIKLLEINGLAGATPKDNLCGVTVGSLNEGGFYLRPVYKTSTLGNMGPLLAYKTWHHVKVVVDTDSDTSSVYLNGTPLISNLEFYAGAVIDTIRQVRTFNNNTSVATNFMIDNLSIKKTETYPFPISTAYTVNLNNKAIADIPQNTSVASLLSNITFTKAATATVYNKTGVAKSSGQIEMGDSLVVNPGNETYSLYFVGILNYNNYNTGTIPPAGWSGMDNTVFSVVPKPLGGTEDPTFTTIPDPAEKAVYVSENGSQSYRSSYVMTQQGDIEFTMDFLVEKAVTNSSVNQIKVCEIWGKKGTGAARVAVNVNVTNAFKLTYSNGTNFAASISAAGSPFGAWHNVKVLASTETDKVSVWYDGALIADNFNFQGLSGDATNTDIDQFTELRVYHGATASTITTQGVKPSPFYFDNLQLRSISNNTTITSAFYDVAASEVSGVLEGTLVNDFNAKISLPYGAAATVYSTYDAQVPGNNVVRTGSVQNGDKLVVKAENMHTTQAYTIKTMPNVVVSLVNTLGVEVTSLAEITDGKISAKAEVINNGFNNNNTNFVLIIAAYSGNKLVDVKYKTFDVPVSDAKVVETLTDFELPNVPNLKISAFVWDGLSNMMPLSLPDNAN